MSKPIVKDVKLPEYPSELLKLALDDLKVIKEDKRYEIDMELFHRPNKKTCSVDLVGAVLANTLKLSRDTSIISIGQAEEYIGEDNIAKMLIICSLAQISLYSVYHGYRYRIDSEEMLISKIEDKIYKKLDKITPKKVDIYKFKDFKKSHDFYSSIVDDIAILDTSILGMVW